MDQKFQPWEILSSFLISSQTDVQRYIKWPNIDFRELEEKYEMMKVEVQEKEVISKQDIQEFLVKSLMEYSHFTAFVHKFVINMEKFKE